MKLTKESLSHLVFGQIESVEDPDGYISFHRLTAYQRETLDRHGFTPRQFATAGIFLEVEGHVRKLSFSYVLTPGSSRIYPYADVCENGVLKKTETLKIAPETGVFTYCPEETGRLTVWFPNLMTLRLKDVEIEGDYKPGVRKKNVLFAGDSITQGYDSRKPSGSYANLLTEHFRLNALNQAIGGDIFDPSNLDPALPFKPDAVFVAYGTNDWSGSHDFTARSDQYLYKLRRIWPEVPVYVILPIWRGEAVGAVRNGMTLDDCREVIRKTAVRFGCEAVNGKELVPHDPELYADDRVLHPNDAGFGYYGGRMIDYLESRGW